MKIRWLPAATFLLCLGVALRAQPADGVQPHAGMLRYPDVSATQIIFVYANKLWIAPREGGLASPVASPSGSVSFPKFSADGKTIAFIGNYDGLRSIYTLPVEGGVPNRVTYHPSGGQLCNWTPDGKLLYSAGGVIGMDRMAQLYVVSPKGGLPEKLPVPYGTDAAVSADGRWLAYIPYSTDFRTWKRYRGGMATDIWLFDLQEKKSRKITDWEGTDTLPMWRGARFYYLSDNGPEHRLNIWCCDTRTGKRQQVTKYADWDVKWPSMGPGPKGEGEIVYQYGSGLYLLDLATGKASVIRVRIPGDRPTLRARAVDDGKYIAGWGISPSGKRAVIEARGDIWTSPVKEGTPRNLTRTSGAAERSPAWSPDGRWIAYLSDATGEYELYITQSDGRGETKQLTRDGRVFRYGPAWSPNSKYIVFADKTGALYLYTVASGQAKLLDTDPWANPLNASWSPDSRWVTYAKTGSRSRTPAIWLCNVETGDRKQVTSGMFPDFQPVFDHKGDYLYFASNRSFRPTYDDLGESWIYTGTHVLLAAPLRADMSSPYNPKSDEETWSEPPKEAQPGKGDEKGPKTGVFAGTEARQTTSYAEDEVSGVWNGTVTGDPIPGGSMTFKATLKLGANNAVTGTLEAMTGSGSITGTWNPSTKELNLSVAMSDGGTATINARISGSTMTGTATVQGMTFQIKAERVGGAAPGGAGAQEKKDGAAPGPKAPEKIAIDFEGFEARAIPLPVKSGRFGQLAVNDRNQLIYARLPVPGSEEPPSIKLFDINDEKKEEKTVAGGASNYDISPDGKKLLVVRGQMASIQDASPGATGDTVVTSGMTAMIEPRAEWKQIFTDAWRMERDFFYDPNMHGVNWPAVRDHYAAMLADCANREDVGYVISEMISELNVGHAYYFGGDIESQPSISVGMLGADFALQDGAYKITKIYQGAPWDSDARGPLSQPGVKVKEGDYLLAVNGVPLDTTRDPWAAFQGMADRVVTLTFSDKPKPDKTARDIPLRLMGSDGYLRYRAWIEKNRAYVEKQTGGRVGYIYVPNTGTDGQNDLVRQLLGQIGKDALIIDERWNGGGQIPTRFIELLNRPVTNYWARRDGNDWPWPPDGHRGPKCMLINGLAGSGGDAFPWYFRQAKLGKLIGTRTWGGLVGLSGNPGLIDGGYASVPTFAFYKPDGTWGVEGHGVDPDIEVMDDPALMVNGGDPQLDAAIKLMLDELKRAPYVPPKRPAYPNRSGMGSNPKDR
jgi:tricorn protease